MKPIALITGADGGMGTEITREVAAAGYRVVMLCYTRKKGEECRRQIAAQTGNEDLEVHPVDLSSMQAIADLCRQLRRDLPSIELLMNNAGTMCTRFEQTAEGFERTVAVNYLAPFLLSNLLLPLMHRGSRIVNMVSCTYRIGKVGNRFFSHGRQAKTFWRIPVYSNTKYALWMFTFELARRLQSEGISVNAADPGIVSTNIIRMHLWFDPLTDMFFRPFIRTPRQGADTAIHLLLDADKAGTSGKMFASNRVRSLLPPFEDARQSEELWNLTVEKLKKFLE